MSAIGCMARVLYTNLRIVERRSQMRGRTVNLNDTEPIVGSGGPLPNGSPGTCTVPVETNVADTVPGGPPSASVFRKGYVVDRYRIVGLIASGGMARVYEAVHVFTQKSVALKVMHHRLSDRRDLVERFRHEAIALSSIRHRNVVNVENAGLTEDGHVFIAMDLLRGQNLRQVLESGKRFELIEALQLVSDVAEGVAAAHDIKIIHRDLKPENIFCANGEPAKVLDLGTAKFAGDNAPTTQTAFGKVVGTAAYIAPERLQGEVGDERCDIYSLGLLLYECIAGFHPLAPTGQWPSAAEVVARQITYNPRSIPGLPSDIWHLIAKAMHKKPDARFRSMHEFRTAITAAVRPPAARWSRAQADAFQVQLGRIGLTDHRGYHRRLGLGGDGVQAEAYGRKRRYGLDGTGDQRAGKPNRKDYPEGPGYQCSCTDCIRNGRDRAGRSERRFDAFGSTSAAGGINRSGRFAEIGGETERCGSHKAGRKRC